MLLLDIAGLVCATVGFLKTVANRKEREMANFVPIIDEEFERELVEDTIPFLKITNSIFDSDRGSER